MKIIPFITFILTLFFSCKKDPQISSVESNIVIPKWNKQFVGSYKGTWTSQPYNSGMWGILSSKDSIINVSVGPTDSSLLLNNTLIIKYSNYYGTFQIYQGSYNFNNSIMNYYRMGLGNFLSSGIKETFNGIKQ